MAKLKRGRGGGVIDKDGRWCGSTPDLQVTPSISKINGAEHLKVRLGTGRMGGCQWGAPGGAPQSPQNLIADHVVAPRLARLWNVSEKEAALRYRAIGRVLQELLIAGIAIGIPHVGVIAVNEYKWTRKKTRNVLASRAELADMEERGLWAAKTLGKRPQALAAAIKTTRAFVPPVMWRTIDFVLSSTMKHFFYENAAYNGPWRFQLAELRQRLSRQRGKVPKQHIKPARGHFSKEDRKAGNIPEYLKEVSS